jgi:hypothetical protein
MVNADARSVKPSPALRLQVSGASEHAQEEAGMASTKQRSAARRNIKKAASAARRKQTLKHLPKRTRQALGKEAAKARRRAA